MCVRSIYGTSVFQPPKAGDIHASNAVFNGIPDSLKKVEEHKTEAPTIASVLEKARRNTIAIQELLKRTGCEIYRTSGKERVQGRRRKQHKNTHI